MPLNDLSGNIVTTGSIVYFVPSNPQRTPLRWEQERQQFTMLGDNPDDRGLCLFLRKTTVSDKFVDASPVNKSVSCCALYGVVSLGPHTSVLLYVTQSERVATLSLQERHEIYAVKHFDWMELPSRVARLSNTEDLDDEKDKKSENKESIANKSFELSSGTIAEYCAVIDYFCTQSNRHSGGSHFFYSSTINIALDPSEIFYTSQLFCEDLSSSFVDEGLSSKFVFQWNIPLLDAFQMQNETQANTQEPLKGTSPQASLYVPSFIRGSVSVATADGVDLLLLSRLSFRWSGTRYNRRGLDSSGSGITAIFSIATLWVFPSQQKSERKNKGAEDYEDPVVSEDGDVPVNALPVSSHLVPPKRIATYQIIRGSIPCRWSQPANLTFKPQITISPPAGASEELSSHLSALAACVPDMRSLYCLDTTSLSSHERHLSEAFEEMVRKYHESDSKQRSYIDILYKKYNLRKRMKQDISYDQMRQEIAPLLRGGDTKSYNPKLGFSRWISEKDDELQENTEITHAFSWRQLQRQECYVRVNCLDCLDRTNLAQSMIVLDVLPHMISYVLEIESVDASAHSNLTDDQETVTDYVNKFVEASFQCRYLWSKQGISLSQIYAGSDPHFLQFLYTGNLGPYSIFEEGKLSLFRWWQQNFYDGYKQDAISLITHQHDPGLFNSKLESPFARRLSGMNKMVGLGLFLALCATAGNVFTAAIHPSFCSGREIWICELLWAIYIAVLVSHILKDAISYTNYPLLT